MALPEAEYDLTAQAFQQKNQKRFSGDKNLWVQFHIHPVKDDEASAREGRPIYRNVDYIKIMIPGNKHHVVDKPVGDIEKRRFAEQYKRWKDHQEADQVSGTPLSKWPPVTAAQVKELEYFNVRTVEQLAELSDVNCQGAMGLQALKSQAKAFLKVAEGGADITRLEHALQERDNQVETLRQAMEEMAAQLRALQALQAAPGPAVPQPPG